MLPCNHPNTKKLFQTGHNDLLKELRPFGEFYIIDSHPSMPRIMTVRTQAKAPDFIRGLPQLVDLPVSSFGAFLQIPPHLFIAILLLHADILPKPCRRHERFRSFQR